MPHVLLIRSLEDALPMVLELKSKGIESSHYPLFTPQFLPIPPLENPQAIIVTSKNGVRALVQGGLAITWNEGRRLESANYSALKKIPLYAVGDKTAELAKQSGFLNVVSASGTSAELLTLIIKTAHPHKGILWHLSGREVKGNIIESLKKAGFEAQRKIVYEIEDVTELPASLCTHLTHQKFSHVIFCSPRTTHVFVTLLKKKKLEKVVRQMHALCLSQEIRDKASCLEWKKLWISPRPMINEIMRYFDEK